MKNILDKINRADEIQANLELDKTELAKHEINLGSVENLQKYINDRKSIVSSYDKSITKLAGIYRDLDDVMEALKGLKSYVIKQNDLAGKDYNAIEASAKELGINANDIPVYKQAEVIFNDNQKLISEIDTILKKK
jgi:hypothetical protein